MGIPTDITNKLNRRIFIRNSGLSALFTSLSSGLASATSFLSTKANANNQAQKQFAHFTHACSVGEVRFDRAILWCRSSCEAKIQVELSLNASFAELSHRFVSESKTEKDFNCKFSLIGLQSNTQYFYRLSLPENADLKLTADKTLLVGTFKSACKSEVASIKFCWSGDTAGQGYGIDSAQGGMRSYATMLERSPDFFVHCGDQIYADNPLESEKTSPDGVKWKNVLTIGKAKVAETVQQFRENFYYNFLDSQVRSFHQNVPTYHMWDDHEVVNNWYHGEILDDERYGEKNVSVLAKRAKQAYIECLPVAEPENSYDEVGELYRHVPRGPLLDLFFIDLRSYKSINSINRQKNYDEGTYIFGPDQLAWLKKSLASASGLWKIICIDMPLSVRVNEWGTDVAENAANGPGPALGRELEYKALLEFIKAHNISNVHFITADVHYCASYHCDPARAVEKNFTPFWEFISGPLHAGTFGPNELDPSFGPKAHFIGLPEKFAPGASPAANLQFFGEIEINSSTKNMTVRHINRIGKVLWQRELSPVKV